MELTLTRHDFGLTWTVEEAFARSAHALVDGERVWLVDPIDDPQVIAPIRELGRPVAVVQLLDRHNRDCKQVADDLGVAHLSLPDELPDSPFQVITVLARKRWRERALWWPEREILVVAEALGTAPLFALGSGPVGVHPLLRLTPPTRLGAYRPTHLLVGHGPPLSGSDTAEDVQQALARSRRDLPRLLWRLPAAMRS